MHATSASTRSSSRPSRFRRLAAAAAITAAAATAATAAGAALGASPASAAPRPHPAPTTAPCPTGTWSPTAAGRPATLAPGAATGMYLWHDADGWHLRVTHPGTSRMVVTGTIDSTGPLEGVTRALESNDRVRFTHVKGKVTFRFENRGRIDGIDFRVGCSNRFTVNGTVNGVGIATTQVFLGSGSSNPTSVPFAMERS